MTATASKPAHAHTSLPAIAPHLVCQGANDAIDFYKKAFGAREILRIPGPDGRLMHGEININGATVMLTDEWPQCGSLSPKSLNATTVTLHLYVDEVDTFMAEAESVGAKVAMPPSDMFWGDRYGVLVDPFGHRWSIATHQRDLNPDELQKAASDFMAKMACGAS